MTLKTLRKLLLIVAGLVAGIGAWAQSTPPSAPDFSPNDADEKAEIARKLSNPLASLISVPLQNNFDFGAGPSGNGFQYKLNIQPVVPFALSPNMNLLVRPVIPVIYQNDVIGHTTQSGLGDSSLSLFFTPNRDPKDSIVLGLGPDFYLPTATETLLGAGKWGLGPTAVALRQMGPWTYGILASHIWSVAGSDNRQSLSLTYLQPFLAYLTKTHTTFTLDMEDGYDWVNNNWSAPINFTVSQVFKLGKLPISLQAGGRYYVESPPNGPVWGLRCGITFVLPK